MKKETLAHFVDYPDLVLFGFLLFFVCFLGVLIWVNLKSRRLVYQNLELLPLESDELRGSHER